MVLTRTLLTATITIMTVAVAIARDAPTTGMVYGEKERHSLTYDCTLGRDDVLSCEFVQTAVRKKAKLSDWPGVVAEAKKGFQQDQKNPPKGDQCFDAKMATYVSALRGGSAQSLPADVQQKLRGLSTMERQDILSTLEGLQNYCTKKTEAALLAVAKIGFERDLRTCEVSSNTFKQEFRWVDDFGGAGAWVVSAAPQGPCGVVQLSRFERSAKTEKAFNFWNYYSRKAVTNPQGKAYGLMKCSQLDQDTYPYTYLAPSEAGLKCDYIKFSPF